MSSKDGLVVLGRIVGVFGVGGWLKINSFTDPPDNILKYPQWQVGLRDQWQVLRPLQGRLTAKGVQVQIEGIADRTAAERWRGADIAVHRSELPPAAPGEYYWVDLIGLQAVAPNGAALGKIVEIRDTPAHAVLLIRGDAEAGKAAPEYWVPLVPERLKSVDIGGKVIVDWYPDW